MINAGGHGIAVFAHEAGFYAVDNRRPHMVFPLSRGTVRDGLLTCHWHHARFDLEWWGTLDPFADNALIPGSFFVEAIYQVPGIGRYFVTTVQDKDYPVLMAVG